MKVKLITISFIGAGESGKSTILKQMRLIYTKDGFTKNEKEEWRVIIFNNILDGLRMVVDAMSEYNITFAYENTSVSSKRWPNFAILANICSPGSPTYNNARERPPAI